MRLRGKLFVSYFALISIPLLVFMFLSFERTRTTIETLVRYSTEKSIGQSGDFLELRLRNLIETSNGILKNESLVQVLARPRTMDDVLAEMNDYTAMTRQLSLFYNGLDIYKISLYVEDRLMYASSGDNFLRLSEATGAEWYSRLQQSSGNLVWAHFAAQDGLPGRDATFSSLRMLLDPDDYQKSIAVVRVDVQASLIDDLLNKAAPTKNSVAYILDADDRVLAASRAAIPDTLRIHLADIQKFPGQGASFGEWSGRSAKMLWGYRNLALGGLVLVAAIPLDDLLTSAEDLRRDLLLVLLGVTLIALLIASAVSGSLSRRVHILDAKMKRIYQGDFTPISGIGGSDEISDLQHSFNYMSARLATMVEERFAIGQKAREFELKALQAQINPHFLYNTLDLIKWTAINHQVPEIAGLVSSLSRFYKLSLSRGSDQIPIREELEHARVYLDIQNQKYAGAFELVIDADPNLLECTTLKILLQPLVENAIGHGILCKESKKGRITIAVQRQDDRILMRVSDDGVGIDQAVLASLPGQSGTREGHGYGIRNIDERIKLHFGPDYGLSFSSEPGRGTTATIAIPVT